MLWATFRLTTASPAILSESVQSPELQTFRTQDLSSPRTKGPYRELLLLLLIFVAFHVHGSFIVDTASGTTQLTPRCRIQKPLVRHIRSWYNVTVSMFISDWKQQ